MKERQCIFYGWEIQLEQRNAINLEWFKRRWKAHRTGWVTWLGENYYDRPTYQRKQRTNSVIDRQTGNNASRHPCVTAEVTK